VVKGVRGHGSLSGLTYSLTWQHVPGKCPGPPRRTGQAPDQEGAPPRRVHFPRLECRTDATHVLRCLLGTGVRLVNWALAASAGVSAMCLAFGVSRNVLVCRLFEARARPGPAPCALAAAAVSGRVCRAPRVRHVLEVRSSEPPSGARACCCCMQRAICAAAADRAATRLPRPVMRQRMSSRGSLQP